MKGCTCNDGSDITCKECCKEPKAEDLKLPPMGVVTEVEVRKDEDGTEWVNEVHHDANEIRESMEWDHPGHYSPERKSYETIAFEEVLESIQVERTELEAQEADLLEQLRLVRERLETVTPIEGTMTWLQNHIFNFDHKQESVRQILPTSPVYNKLMLTYHRLKNSKELVETASGVKKLRKVLDGSPRGWRCELCYRGFQCEADLKRHVESNCEYHGNEEFQKTEDLKRSIRERSCDVCSFKAVSVAGLKTHIRLKHPVYYAEKFGKKSKKGKK